MTSKGGWGLFSKKKTEKPEDKTTATEEESVNKSSKNEPNDYATWSLGLWHLVKISNNDKYKVRINNLKIAEDKDGGDITFGYWSKLMQIIKDVRDIKSADYLDYKLLDLGGGDQNKIREALYAGKSIQTGGGDSVETIVKKFKANKGTLITGGSLEQRIETLKEFILNEKVNEHTYALLPEMETKLTALSYYDKAMEIIKTKNIDSLCLLPIGSTDAHIIIYNRDGNVKTKTHTNYKDLSKSEYIDVQECDHYVFAGSATYYVKENTGSVEHGVKRGVHYDGENKKSKDFTNLMEKLKLPEGKDFSNYSIGGKGTKYVDMGSNAVEKCLEIASTSIKDGGKNKHTKKNKKIVMKSRRNKKAKRKTKSNKRSNRKNKSKHRRR